jgi:aminoglycoside phosphotransferase family enzyme/ATP/ADP translocase/predicted kinase
VNGRTLSRVETAKASLLSAWFFLTVATLWLLKSVRVTALLIHLGARETPYVRLAGVAAVGAAVLVYSIATSRMSRISLVRATCAAFAVALLASWIAVKVFGDALASQRSFVWATYVLVDVYAVVMIQTFWTYTNDVVTPDEANRLYGIIGLGGILGGAFGGALVDFCARAISADDFMLIACGIVIACAGLATVTERVLRPPPRKTELEVSGNLDSALAGVQEVAKSRYLLLIVGVVVGYELTATMTDFGVNVIFEHAHLGEHQLAQMYGRLGWIASGVAVMAQLVLVPLLLPSKRVALLLPPFALLASVVGVVILPVLATTIVMASVDRGLNYSIQQSTRESLYVPLDDTQKYKAKAFIDMFVDHAAKAVASMILLVLIAFDATPRVTLVCSMVAMFGWIVFAKRLGHYAGRAVPEPHAAAKVARALAVPAAYEAAFETNAVEARETPLSRVYLLDDDVLKVKKPVNLGGFFDLRSLAQRQAACNAEVKLNQRFAPDVYKGVVPIVRQGGRLVVGGEGDPIEYAVHMKRLRDDGRADRLLDAGVLGRPEIDAIARRIAEIHAVAPSADGDRWGSLEAIEHNVEESFAQTRRVLEHYLARGDANDVVRFQTRFLRDHAETFQHRVATGRIRDGHGDLRLQHVYLDAPKNGMMAVTVIDCIELNERFRVADVCSDVACLSMDLAAHARVDLAERLLSTYARDTGDYEIYGVVDFYESYRAFVRGKIAALLASDPSKSTASRRAAAAEARRYFVLALVCGRRDLLAPSVIAVGGAENAAKRAIAERVRDETSAAVVVDVDADVLRHANVVLGSGRSVVLDATFRTPATRRAARGLAARHDVPFLFVECATGGASTIDTDGELHPDEHVVVDATQHIDRALMLIRSRIATWPHGLTA